MTSLSQTRLAARLQDLVGRRRLEAGLYQEIADALPLPDTGRLLDIGTGTGYQLQVIHQTRPALQLYSLALRPPPFVWLGRTWRACPSTCSSLDQVVQQIRTHLVNASWLDSADRQLIDPELANWNCAAHSA